MTVKYDNRSVVKLYNSNYVLMGEHYAPCNVEIDCYTLHVFIVT